MLARSFDERVCCPQSRGCGCEDIGRFGLYTVRSRSSIIALRKRFGTNSVAAQENGQPDQSCECCYQVLEVLLIGTDVQSGTTAGRKDISTQ